MAPKKKPVRRTTRKKAAPAAVEEAPATVEEEKKEEVMSTPEAEPQVQTTEAVKPEQTKSETPKAEPKAEPKRPEIRKISPNIVVRDFCDLANQGGRISLLSDQQIQQLTYEDAIERNEILERIMRQVLDYDIVLSDTNIWLELLVGHTSSHSDPKVNARLQFERQLDFISKIMKRIGGRFMIMSETYEEVDRFAATLDPISYKDADWTDEVLCRNVAARLAKRLMLAMQKENRLRIEGICSECHHGAFADPAIIRRTVELFAQGKKVLLLTNDASVGIRSLGMCDDLQRVNKVDDKTWREVYEPQRPMVLTMDDLKLLDQYTRQYHFLLAAAGRQWMQDVDMRESAVVETPLNLWLDGFRPGDRHERRSEKMEQQRKEQERKEQQRAEQQRKEQERAEQQRKEQERKEQERKEQQRAEQQRKEQERREQQRKEQERKEQQKQANEATSTQPSAEELQGPEATMKPEAAQSQENTQEALPSTEAVTEVVSPATETEKKPRSRRGGRRRSSKGSSN